MIRSLYFATTLTYKDGDQYEFPRGFRTVPGRVTEAYEEIEKSLEDVDGLDGYTAKLYWAPGTAAIIELTTDVDEDTVFARNVLPDQKTLESIVPGIDLQALRIEQLFSKWSPSIVFFLENVVEQFASPHTASATGSETRFIDSIARDPLTQDWVAFELISKAGGLEESLMWTFGQLGNWSRLSSAIDSMVRSCADRNIWVKDLAELDAQQRNRPRLGADLLTQLHLARSLNSSGEAGIFRRQADRLDSESSIHLESVREQVELQGSLFETVFDRVAAEPKTAETAAKDQAIEDAAKEKQREKARVRARMAISIGAPVLAVASIVSLIPSLASLDPGVHTWGHVGPLTWVTFLAVVSVGLIVGLLIERSIVVAGNKKGAANSPVAKDPKVSTTKADEPDGVPYELRHDGVMAKGSFRGLKFYVETDGTIPSRVAPNAQEEIVSERRRMLDKSVLVVAGSDSYKFASGYLFSSKQFAASVLLGRNIVGEEWSVDLPTDKETTESRSEAASADSNAHMRATDPEEMKDAKPTIIVADGPIPQISVADSLAGDRHLRGPQHVDARGHIKLDPHPDEGQRPFVVKMGSLARKLEAPSIGLRTQKVRAGLRDTHWMRATVDSDGRVIEANNDLLDFNVYRFEKDWTASSPSLAASVVLGRQATGEKEWKTSTVR